MTTIIRSKMIAAEAIVIKEAKTIATLYCQGNTLFSATPKELLAKIATFSGRLMANKDPNYMNTKKAEGLVEKIFYPKPKSLVR